MKKTRFIETEDEEGLRGKIAKPDFNSLKPEKSEAPKKSAFSLLMNNARVVAGKLKNLEQLLLDRIPIK